MVKIKTAKELELMREGGKILAKIMKELTVLVRPGISAATLNKIAKELIFKNKAQPSFEGYQGFPATLCVSLNEEVVHGLPLVEKVLKEGDIVSLDLGIFYKGFHSDMAVTLPVGNVAPEILRFLRVGKKALKRALKVARPGKTLGDLGNTIQRYVESQGFQVIKDLCGHGIGRDLHEEPQVLNYGKRRKGFELKEGMVICIEPIISMGSGEIRKAADGFTYKTKDNSLSAHFEETVAVLREGPEVFTPLPF